MKIYLSRFSMLDNSLKINELDWIFPHCLNHSEFLSRMIKASFLS